MHTRNCILALSLFLFFSTSTALAYDHEGYFSPYGEDDYYTDDIEQLGEGELIPYACTRANRLQLEAVNEGYAKLSQFLQSCAEATGNSSWCSQLARPNPSSISVFRCTYGADQPHYLIQPNVETWQNAFEAVHLVQELENSGIKVCQIYNWWRPEPYNRNVGGAKGRHPYGTSVDVRFCSKKDANRAFDKLCKLRKTGRIRAIGHYGTSALHFGVGDDTGNTWGRKCR